MWSKLLQKYFNGEKYEYDVDTHTFLKPLLFNLFDFCSMLSKKMPPLPKDWKEKLPPLPKIKKDIISMGRIPKIMAKFEPIKKKIGDIGKKYIKRSVDKKTADLVYSRDNYTCVCCGFSGATENQWLDIPHHAFYGAFYAKMYEEERNSLKELVTVCNLCHTDIHDKGNEDKRQKCMDYLKKIYE